MIITGILIICKKLQRSLTIHQKLKEKEIIKNYLNNSRTTKFKLKSPKNKIKSVIKLSINIIVMLLLVAAVIVILIVIKLVMNKFCNKILILLIILLSILQKVRNKIFYYSSSNSNNLVNYKANSNNKRHKKVNKHLKINFFKRKLRTNYKMKIKKATPVEKTLKKTKKLRKKIIRIRVLQLLLQGENKKMQKKNLNKNEILVKKMIIMWIKIMRRIKKKQQ